LAHDEFPSARDVASRHRTAHERYDGLDGASTCDPLCAKSAVCSIRRGLYMQSVAFFNVIYCGLTDDFNYGALRASLGAANCQDS
jgi:hypothetical protein